MTAINPAAARLISLLAARDFATETLTEAEWESVIDLAQQHNVAPVLYARLKKRGIMPPPTIAEQLRQIYIAAATRNVLMFHELGRILRALQAANITVIPLKGACLAEAVYGNIGLRTMVDVDVLVKPDDFAKASRVLRAYTSEHSLEMEGARRATRPVFRHDTQTYHMPHVSIPGGLTVDMHWTIVDPHNHVNFAENELEQLWLRATPVTIGGIEVLMLSPVDLLLHLCSHASVHHGFADAGLRNYLDVALVIHRYGDVIDWEQLTARANRWGIANGVRLVLQLAEEWTGVVIPASALSSLTTAPPDDATIAWVRHKIWSGCSFELQSDVPRFAGKVRLVDKLGVLRDVLFPSRVVMARMYHVPEESWRILCYYPLRCKDLWMRYRQVMWKLLCRDKKLTTEALQEARLREYLGWN